jgi:ketosteroid isomerase-like protein
MKSITARILALTVLSLCATPFARAGSAGDVEAKLKSMEDAWSAGLTQKDHGVGVVSGLVAADYHGVSSEGKIQNKDAMLEEMRTSTDTTISSKNDSMEVHLYGVNVATVVGTSSEKGKDKDGKDYSRNYAWTDTWMERNGKWQCIGEAVTRLPAKE